MTTDLVFHFGDPQAVPFLFWLLAALGALLGAVVFLLLRFPRLRRAEMRGGGSYPRLGLGAGLLLFALFLAAGWQYAWGGFFTLTTSGNGVTLHFRVPTRAVDIAAGEVAALDRDPEAQGGGQRLVIRDRQGRVFRSTRVSREAVDESMRILAPRLLSVSSPPPPGDGG